MQKLASAKTLISIYWHEYIYGRKSYKWMNDSIRVNITYDTQFIHLYFIRYLKISSKKQQHKEKHIMDFRILFLEFNKLLKDICSEDSTSKINHFKFKIDFTKYFLVLFFKLHRTYSTSFYFKHTQKNVFSSAFSV